MKEYSHTRRLRIERYLMQSASLRNPPLFCQRLLVIALVFVLNTNFCVADDGPRAPKDKLQFSFNRAPWEMVVDWMAKSADLALHVGELPTGTFTYVDSRAYTPDEAISRINLF